MKDAGPLDATRKIANQVRIMSLPVTSDSGARFEGYHTLLEKALIPSFDAYVKSRDSDTSSLIKGEESRSGGIAGVKKKLAELGLGMKQLQDNEDIPIPIFHLHPEIQRVMDGAL